MSVLASTSRAVGRGRRAVRIGRGEAGVGLLILAILVFVAVAAPLIAPYSPDAIDSKHILAAPSWSHPFGFDALGRDVLSRVVYAYRTSLAISVGAVALALVLGLPIGVVAGYFGGWVDNMLMRPVDLLLALPALLLAISLISIFGPGEVIALFAIAVIYLPILARVVRSAVLAVSRELYVEGARARGASHLRTIVAHVVPNAIGPAIVQASVLAGFALQIEAALSFLGLGAQPPTASLGLMLADGYQVLQQAPWADIFPGLAIAITVVAFNLVGDGLRARLDPRGISE
ncbi:MAG TPA: ABC transporter permease [Gaiellaceae bacterium]|jgi:peptide/nickel transport system permease protein